MPPLEISVVIATHNGRDRLRRCLDALSAQALDPSTFEVIVADDGSTDGTPEMAEGLETPFRLRVLRLKKAGQYAAVNAAIEASDSPVCLFIDDDVTASEALVSEHLAAHRTEAMTLGIGDLSQEPPPGRRDWFAKAYANTWNRRYRELADRKASWVDCYGGNFSASRALLLAVGGFSVDLPAVEDLELGFRLQQAGGVPTYLPRAAAVHHDEKGRKRLLAAIARFAAFAVEFADSHPAARSKLLGWYGDAALREAVVRRLLIALRVSPTALAGAGRLIPGTGRRQVWCDFIARYAFWLAVRRKMTRRRWMQATRGVPVLMYHAFTDSGERDRFVAPARSFARQMLLLAVLRYRVISFETLARALREGDPLPKRAAVITIDDGYRDNFETARPILLRRGFSATVFLVSERLDFKNDWDDGGTVKDRPLLSIDQIREMRADGFDMGAHTRTHCSLSTLAKGAASKEIEGSRSDLEAALGTPVATFAYPFGELDDSAVAIVARAGFLGACTTRAHLARPGDDPLLIPRLEIMGSDSIVRFLRKLWFGGS